MKNDFQVSQMIQIGDTKKVGVVQREHVRRESPDALVCLLRGIVRRVPLFSMMMAGHVRSRLVMVIIQSILNR